MARLPFIQAAQDLFPRARMLARFLRIPESQGVGLAVMLEAWAVEMAPEGDTSGQIADDHPEEVVAAALGWDGDPSALYAALIRARFITKTSGETEAGFDFVPGLDKYAKALGLPTTRSESASKAAKIMWERKKDASRIESACEPQATGMHDAKRGDAKTQTQTQTEETTLGADAPENVASVAPTAAGQVALVEAPKPAGPQPEDLQTLWNRLAPPKGLQRWTGMSDKRRRDARVSLRDSPSLSKWEAWLAHELQRPFNLGDNPSGWKADVDWLLRAKTRDLVNDFDPAVAARVVSGGDRPRLPPRESPPESPSSSAPARRVIL